MGASFKDLVVWQLAIQLCAEIYRVTSEFPKAEQFGLMNQMRRASVSIPSNIAEGYGKSSTGEYILFLGHARGSLGELQTQIILARMLGFGSKEMLDLAEENAAHVSRMLNALIRKLKS